MDELTYVVKKKEGGYFRSGVAWSAAYVVTSSLLLDDVTGLVAINYENVEKPLEFVARCDEYGLALFEIAGERERARQRQRAYEGTQVASDDSDESEDMEIITGYNSTSLYLTPGVQCGDEVVAYTHKPDRHWFTAQPGYCVRTLDPINQIVVPNPTIPIITAAAIAKGEDQPPTVHAYPNIGMREEVRNTGNQNTILLVGHVLGSFVHFRDHMPAIRHKHLHPQLPLIQLQEIVPMKTRTDLGFCGSPVEHTKTKGLLGVVLDTIMSSDYVIPTPVIQRFVDLSLEAMGLPPVTPKRERSKTWIEFKEYIVKG